VDHDNRQSANGDVTQSSATAVTQQPVVQSTATADIMPAYTYAHTWPGYAVRMSTVFHQCCVIFTGRRKGILTKNHKHFSDNQCTSDRTGHEFIC